MSLDAAKTLLRDCIFYIRGIFRLCFKGTSVSRLSVLNQPRPVSSSQSLLLGLPCTTDILLVWLRSHEKETDSLVKFTWALFLKDANILIMSIV